MRVKFFGYAPWALIRLVIDDYPIPVPPGNVSFITLCIGPIRKIWPLCEGKGVGRFLYKHFYRWESLRKEYRNYERFRRCLVKA